MMKKIFAIVFLMLSLCAVSCNKETSKSKDSGKLSFSLGYDGGDYITVPTKTDFDLNDLKVVIRKSTGEIVEEYASYSEVPSSITMVPGQYKVEALSAESEPAAFEQPTFYGSKDFTIEAGVLTTVDVVCSIDNVKVTIALDDSFKSEITSYTITVRAVNYNKSLVFNPEDIDAGRAGYFYESPIEIHIIGKRVFDGSEVNFISTIEDVRKKDHLILNLSAKATGEAGSLAISIDYTTNDRNEDVVVPGFPEEPVEGGDPGDDGEKPTVEFSCGDEVTFTDAEAAAAEVNVTVSAEEGIENLYVKIESETLLGLLGQLGLGDVVASGNWDIANVTDSSLATFLGGLGLYDESDPVKGKKEHLFSIGSFMALMPAQDDPYPFAIKVIDSKGNETERRLIIHRVK